MPISLTGLQLLKRKCVVGKSITAVLLVVLEQVPANSLVSQSFVLAGKDGRVHARLSAKAGNPVMEFYDSKGHVIWFAPSQSALRPADSN